MPIIPIYLQDFSPGSSDEVKTRLGNSGFTRQRYGTFVGKTASPISGLITRLGLSGFTRQRYGSFAGKTASAADDTFPSKHVMLTRTPGMLLNNL